MYEKGPEELPEFAHQMSRKTMFERVGNPEELKGSVFCTQANGWVTGLEMLVDSGAVPGSTWHSE
jgi:hypothetical protein